MKEIIDFFSKTNHKKSAISIVIMIFVVGLFSSVNNLGSTYAATYGCYKCGGGNYFWGSDYNQGSCDYYAQYPSQSACEAQNVFYGCFNCSGTYIWGNSKSQSACTYVSSYTSKSSCESHNVTYGCYKCSGGKYFWGSSYNQGSCDYFPNFTNESTCEAQNMGCYKCGNGEYFWGSDYNQNSCDYFPNYTTESTCKAQNDGCYKCGNGKYFWGSSYNQSSCDYFPDYTDESTCKAQNDGCYKCGNGEYFWGSDYNQSSCDYFPDYTDESTCKAQNSSGGGNTPSTPTSYTVSYNANGGSGAPASQTKTHGTNLTLSSTEPTRTGYKFLGWATSNTATSAKYSAGGTYSDNASVTLYAVWKPYCVTITFYAGGGSVTSKTSAGTWTVTNDLIALNGDSQLSQLCNGRDFTGTSLVDYNNSSWLYITKSGYSVPEGSEWKCKSGCTTSGKVFDQAKTNQPSDFCDNSKKDCSVQLIVNWKANTYSVKFDANGGSGAPATQTKTHGTNLTLSSTVPTKAGYKFLGWTTSSTSTTVKYNAGSTYSDNKAVTLYAVWAPYKLSIYYYANGGIVTSKTSGGTWTVKNDLIFKDAAEYVTSGFYGKTLSSDGLVNYNNDEYLEITKIGYSAVSGAEWKCKSGCATSGKTFDQVTAYKVSDFCDISKSDCKVELAVNWAPTTYKISYDLNGGMISGNPSSAKFDEVVTINNPSKTVSIVADENGTGAIIGESASVISKFLGWTSTSIDTNTAYHGSTAWKDGSTKVVDISFKNLASVKDKTVKLVANWESTSLVLPTISKNGYNCSWNTKNTGKGTSYNSGATYSVVNDTDSSIKLYAICKLPGSNISSDGSSNTNTDSGIKNPQTGRPLMIATISIALFALGYVIYGVKKGKISF